MNSAPKPGPTPLRRRLLAGVTSGTLCVLGLATAGTGTAHAVGTTYYVATTGSDSNSGTSPAAPFLTISTCAAVAVAGDSCLIEGGSYPETVVPANSGTASAPITFAPYNGQQVTVTGADPVTGWSPYQGSIYRAPAVLAPGYDATETPADGDLAANQIFQNGTMLPEAQYPAPGGNPMHPATAAFSSITSGSGTQSGALADSKVPALPSVNGAVIDFTGGWTLVSGTVTASSSGSVSYSLPSSDSSIYPPNSGNTSYRLLGSLSLLTAPGEWFYDATGKQLYVWAPGGGVPSGITAKKRNYAFDLRGRSDITVTGIGVTASTVITDNSSTGILLNAITGSYLSHFETQQYDPTLPFGGVYDAAHRADTGIILDGSGNTIRNSVLEYSAGNGVALNGNDNTASNNLIHDVAYGGTYTSGVTLFGLSTGQLVTHNTIYSTARDGINVNTNVPADEAFHGNRISYNDVSDYGTVQRDLGGIYTCCNIDWSGSRIDHNTVHDPSGTANGIYLDNGTYDVQVDHNITWGNNNGLHANGTTATTSKTNDLIYNNTFAETTYSMGTAHLFGNSVVENNIDTAANGSTSAPVYRDNIDPPTNPGFVNRWGLDFHLAAGSPALGAGVAVPGVTVNSTGAADIGAYESGDNAWTSGCTLTGCHPVYPLSIDDSAIGTTADTIDYLGSGWAHCAACSGTVPLWNNSNSYDDTTGASLSFTFTGTAIQYHAVTDTEHGIASVSVDGGPATLVDLYAATRKGDVDVWNSKPLAEGTHTLTITVTGTKNAASTGTYVTLDRLVVSP
ncbi:right-handed parallel beta-helix repeat-containing protein [Streptacidiphilus sp. P02-A3a]|uniref:right-handed parallel beta-helix repeat-containing protein n=1 Tax=Streptacidiphilus sp. P02-A3a TaxID=2704468 RepID=UPI0015F84789|nr:right-handed parallel beta-helix repeat-containing protein [Streptacidiphilus sp. P02-A3a]QMU69800.1 right-handed parallel beta-helix repeat-containing protein [Streptacidiphilus sp. P02-A3a]